MLTRLHFENFRTFGALTAEKLARVNLFVGQNNAGKTSLLQGAEILIRGGGLTALWISAKERGEFIVGARTLEPSFLPAPIRVGRAGIRPPEGSKAIDPRHLFHGHAMQLGSKFTLRGGNGTPAGVACEVTVVLTEDLLKEGPLPVPGDLPLGPLSLRIEGPRLDKPVLWPLSSDGGLYLDFRLFVDRETTPLSTMWSNVGTGSPDTAWLGSMWDSVLLQPEETWVTEALRIIEPSVERLAFMQGSPGAFFVKLASVDTRIPLGTMGEGMPRLLSLVLHLVRAKGSYLLVDEIDTGLHHSVMEAMWRMLIETARRLDAQILATTHSLDCVHALGLASADAEDVLLHRIDRERPTTTIFTADDIVIAAEHDLEIRG